MLTIYKLLNLFNVTAHTPAQGNLQLLFAEQQLFFEQFRTLSLTSGAPNRTAKQRTAEDPNRSQPSRSTSCASFQSTLSLSVKSLPTNLSGSSLSLLSAPKSKSLTSLRSISSSTVNLFHNESAGDLISWFIGKSQFGMVYGDCLLGLLAIAQWLS